MTISERVDILCRRAGKWLLVPLQGELPFFVVCTLMLALCPVATLVVCYGFDLAHTLVWLAFYVGTSVFFSWIGCWLVWLLKKQAWDDLLHHVPTPNLKKIFWTNDAATWTIDAIFLKEVLK